MAEEQDERTAEELREELRQAGLATSGNKDELLERLREHEEGNGDDEAAEATALVSEQDAEGEEGEVGHASGGKFVGVSPEYQNASTVANAPFQAEEGDEAEAEQRAIEAEEERAERAARTGPTGYVGSESDEDEDDGDDEDDEG